MIQRSIPYLLFVCFFFIGLWISPYIGPSWDEPDNIFAGGVYLRFFREQFNPEILTIRLDQKASIFGDRIFSQNTDLERYPPFPLILGSFFVVLAEQVYGALSGEEIIQMFHVASGMFVAVTAVFTYGISRLLRFPLLFSIVSAILLGLTPTMFGHGYSTIKDSAQVAMFTVSLYILFRFTTTHRKRWLLLGAVAWGLGLSTKFNAVYVPIIWGIFHLSQSLLKTNPASKIHYLKATLLEFVTFSLIGLFTLFLSWPYLWFDPIPRVQQIIAYFTTVGIGFHVAWLGQKLVVGDVTALWWYPLGSMLLATPIPILIAFLLGLGSMLYHSLKKPAHSTIHRAGFLLIILWLVIPFLRTISPKASYYDGMRHFMEVLPSAAIISTFGIYSAVRIARFLFVHLPSINILAIFLAVPICIHAVIINLRFFPFSSGYLNMFAGEKRNELFDRDFSGLSVREGMTYINSKQIPYSVYVPIAGHTSWYYIDPGNRYVYYPEEADFIIFVNKISHASKQELEQSIPKNFVIDRTIQKGSDIFGWVYKKNVLQ